MKEVKRVTKKEYENYVEDRVAEGYKLQSKTEREANLVKRNLGKGLWHFIIALLTIWWTFGLGNLVYLLFAYFCRKDEISVKVSK